VLTLYELWHISIIFDKESSIHIEMLRDVHDRVFRDLIVSIDYNCIRGKGMKANRAQEADGVVAGFLQEFRQSGQEIARLEEHHAFSQIQSALGLDRRPIDEALGESKDENEPDRLERCRRRGLDLDSRRIG
jgi:hypothetical protein